MSLVSTLFMFVAASLLWQPETLAADGTARYDQRDRAQALVRNESFYDLPVYRPSGRATRARLDVRYAESRFNGELLRHRSYNGGLTGPVIRVLPGTTLKIRMANHLPHESGMGGHDPNVPHNFNTTNLHTHGLHVSPSGKSDNVYVSIAPGAHQEYEIHVPFNHPAGTFWYHAHHHGSVALQLSSGMAGALIVEGGLDNAPRISEMREQILVIQQFKYRLVPGEPAIIHPDDIYSETSTALPITAVNGQVTPTIVMRPGEIQRWRIIHAGIEDPLQLTTDMPLKIYSIAFDGLATGTISEMTDEESWLNPGFRLDVLVQVPLDAAEGSSYLLSTAVGDPKKSFRKRTVPTTALVKVAVQGPPKNATLPQPADLASYAAFKPSDVPTDAEVGQTPYRIEFQTGNDAMMRPFFRINGVPYDPNAVSHTMQLGTAEEWRIKGTGSHPFHIHVNPFAVKMAPGADGKPKWLWRDTVLINDDETTIRTRYKDYCGKFVLHCHILDHEDQGMMQNLEIVSGSNAPCRAEPAEEGASAGSPAPEWSVPDPDGRPFRAADLRGQMALLVFHRGLSCLRCAQQLVALGERRKAFLDEGVRIVAISPELPGALDLQKIRVDYNLAFTMLADPARSIFASHGCLSFEGESRHGVFLINRQGAIIWSAIGEQPYTNFDHLLNLSRDSVAVQ